MTEREKDDYIRELEAALQWCLNEGGWRLVYYADKVPEIIDATDAYNAKVRKKISHDLPQG